MTPPRRSALGLFLLSAGVLCYELLLMRVFSVLMWYHFASLAIGLALVGLGAGGVAVGLAPRLKTDSWAAGAAAAFGLGVLGVLGFLAAARASPELAEVTLAPFHQPFYRPFARPDGAGQGAALALRLGGLALVAGLPFLGAGVTTASLLARAAPRLHGLYAATFLGSATGCLVAPAALGMWSAPAVLGVAAALGAAGAALLAPTWLSRAGAWALCAAAALAGGVAQVTGGAEIPFAQSRYEPGLLAVRWNAMSRVAAFPLSAADVARPFGVSRTYRGPVPPQVGLVVDDSGYTNLFEGATSRANPDFYRANIVALPYHLRPDARALALGPGGGKDLWIALSFPETTVRAVEINPDVVAMAEEVFGDFTGRPYSDPRVALTVSDARRFAALDRGEYDVIGASAVFGRLPPAAGAFTLSEDLLHTREAFRDYWRRLSPRGILSLSHFAYDQRALRLAALARELLEGEGAERSGDHVRVVSDRGLANVMVGRAPFSAADDELLAARVAELGFTWLYPLPDGAGETALTEILDGPSLEGVLAALSFDVTPPTDDRPFFYYTLRPRDFLGWAAPDRAGFDNRGAELLRAAFLGLGALTLGALLAPLAVARGFPRGGVAPLCFAACLGLGFMALEIGTMKRLSLFLGHPVHAASATLFGFLLGGGAGSLWAGRAGRSRRALPLALVAASVLGLVQAFGAPRLLAPALGLPDPIRWAVAAGLVLPLAFALGVCFPTGMALLGRAGRQVIPWAWAVNGAASVMGSVGSVLLAMNFGYTATLVVGSALYLLALVASAGFPREAGS